jgi:ubiquinone/menaquinone biosynthesis C-methylase UbiE
LQATVVVGGGLRGFYLISLLDNKQMSLRGRYVIDRIKKALSNHVKLPVPPYGEPSYWDAAYKSFGPQDSFEWGDVDLSDLASYEYQTLEWDKPDSSFSEKIATTFGKTLSVESNAEKDEPILMLGCGNSKLGEDMIQSGWRGPIIQVDVSSRIIDSMSQRCGSLISNGHMNFIEDDATELSAFRNGMINACVDKGLMDAVYCAEEYDQCMSILKSVNRVLKPGGVFVFLSYSRPEFLLPNLALSNHDWNKPSWDSIQVQELPQIILYRFQKIRKVTNRKKSKATRVP